MTALVRTRDLVRTFGGTVALDGITLDVGAGESLGLCGPNGSGRTTLLRTLAALLPPTAGTVTIAGVDAGRFPFEARTHVMYVGPELPAAAGLRVREYLDFVRGSRGASTSRGPTATTDAALERSALAADADVERLSTGLRKQLALAAALLAAPQVLLLDDPFASLDTAARGRFLDWLTDVRMTGTTVITAVNSSADADALCDVVLRMEQGRVAPRSTPIDAERDMGGTRVRAAGGT